MPGSKRQLFWILPLALAILTQCSTYFNMFYNAEEAYAEARKIHLKAMKNYPDSIVIAPSDEAKAKYDRAIEKSAKVLEVYPKDKKWHPPAYFLLGRSYFYEEEYGKAIRWLRQLQQEYPQSQFIPESYYYIGMAYLQDDQLDKAEEVLKNVIAKYPELDKDQKVSFLLIEIEVKREGEVRAVQRLEQVRKTVKSPDKQRELLFRVAEMYMDLQQYRTAIPLLLTAPNLKKHLDQEYRCNRDLVTCYAAIDSFRVALAILNRMSSQRRFANYDRQIGYNRGALYEQMDSIEAAITAFKKVVGPTDSTTLRGDTSQMVGKALYRLGLLYQKRKRDYKQAQFCFTSIVDRNGRDSAVIRPATTRMRAIRRVHKLRDLLAGKIKPGQDTLSDEALDSLRRVGGKQDSLKRDSTHVDSLMQDSLKHDSTNTDSLRRDSLKGKVQPASKPDTTKRIPVLTISRPDTMYRIGELFYYDLDEPDSAVTAFLALAADSSADTVFGPKAMNAAAFIERNELKDTARSDSLFRQVAKRYPGGEYARRALVALKEIADTDIVTRTGKAEEAYRAAERQYQDQGDVKGAVEGFFNIYKTYSDLPVAPKSLYAAAWLTDNDLRKKTVAIKLYEMLCKHYPNSIYCTSEAKPRVDIAKDTLKAYGLLKDAAAAKAGRTASTEAKKPAVPESGPKDSSGAAKPTGIAKAETPAPAGQVNAAQDPSQKLQPAASDSPKAAQPVESDYAHHQTAQSDSANSATRPAAQADSAASQKGTLTASPGQPARTDSIPAR